MLLSKRTIELSALPDVHNQVSHALALGRAIQLGYLKMQDLDKPVHQLIDGLKVEDFAKGSTTISLDDALKMCSGIHMPKYRILNAAKKGSMNGRTPAQDFVFFERSNQ